MAEQYVKRTYPSTFFEITARTGTTVTAVDGLGDTYAFDESDLVRVVPGGAPDVTMQASHAYVAGGVVHVVTFDGPCVACGRLCFTSDSGDNDGFGDNADSGLDAKDFEMVGPHVPLCVVCANVEPQYLAGVAAAKALWKPLPQRIRVDLSPFEVAAEVFWEAARHGDGYDRMEAAGERGWLPVSSWGRDGWDFLEWPYYVGYVRNTPEGFEFATNCEGDVNVYRFPTNAARVEAMDGLAFWHWQQKECKWVEGIEPDAIPDYLRGLYDPSRTA